MTGSHQRSWIAVAFALLGVIATVPAAARDDDDLAAARQTWAKATSAADREGAAMDLAALLLAHGSRGTTQMLGESANGAGDVMALASSTDLGEAEGLFRGVATGGGARAERGEAGLIATLLAQGSGRDADVKTEIQRLRQHGAGADSVVCLAMETLLPGDEAERPTVADLLNGRMQTLAPGAPFLVSLKVPKPEALTHPPPQPLAHERPAGTIVVAAVIDPQGHPTAPVVLDPGPGHMAPQVVAALRDWRFRPSLLDDKAVAVCYTLTVDYRRR